MTLSLSKLLWPEDRIPWHRAEACKLLKQDIDDGIHEEYKPSDFYMLQEEYFMFFELEKFGKHIYQEIDSRPKREMRFQKKKKAWLYPELKQNQHHSTNNLA